MEHSSATNLRPHLVLRRRDSRQRMQIKKLLCISCLQNQEHSLRTYGLWAPRGCRMSLVSSCGASAPHPSSRPLSGWNLMRLFKMLRRISSSRALC